MVSLEQSVVVVEDVLEDVAELDYYSMLTFLKAVHRPIHPSPDQALLREFQIYLLSRNRIQVAMVVVLQTKIFYLYKILLIS